MPVALNGSVPLPSVRVYTSVTVLLMSACLYYALAMTSDPNWRQHTNITSSTTGGTVPTAGGTASTAANTATSAASSAGGPAGVIDGAVEGAGGKLGEVGGASAASLLSVKEIDTLEEKILAAADLSDLRQMLQGGGSDAPDEDDAREVEEGDERWLVVGNDTRSLGAYLKDTASFMATEPFCIWTLINTAYCCLILLGKSIQKFVFGELRISEQQHMKDKFWNFIFYKFIFVFGVVNVQYLYEVILWVSWFSALGFLHLLSQLSKDRFEYLSFSPTTPGWSHFRLISLLVAILALSGLMVGISIGVGVFFGGFNTFAFMAAECILLSIRTLHVLIRYGMFLHDMRQGGIANESISWDKRGPVAYYIELTFEVAALMVELVHYIHMMLWSNIFLSMASLVILMQLRYLLNEIQRKIKKHRNYLWVLNHMEKSYPLASSDDLKQNSDNCAICWEKMETARKLPCAHLFHNSCLQSWLEQDTSCPTCRLGLSVHQNGGPRGSPLLPDDIRIDDQDGAVGGGGGRTANNHFFHFNGSRYVSWLPNFSVEVTHINSMLRPSETLPITAAAVGNHTSQVRNMARHVQEMFPRYPLSVLIGDLQISRSIEVTIDNILEGRLQVPANSPEDEDEETLGAASVASMAMSGSMDGDNGDDDDELSGELSTRSLTNSLSASSLSSLSSPAGYEVERGTNIFGNYDALLRDDTVEEISSATSVPLGDRFSKSPEEREKILQRRKEQLLAMARRRYLEKNKSELNHQPSTSATASTSSTVRHRNKSCMETTIVESGSSSSSSGSGSSGNNLSKLNPSLSPSHHQQRLSVEQQQPLDEVQQLDHSDSSF
ncbi:E3 ubiquitin-protein ligase AMFR isoform X2 [Anopheles gambiae]|nr:E3 ubiquitin-protein ligase AMFR isoform X2 [Anopheles gambiae]XP_061506959.1 E3 ubiquitin-protein ligase AMFR isoform X2 [Anopheles gambiae]XP_061506960.1 E3 ubiquitin-protein ligase AMFR isoform X2 [Anopheles gambiae]XP_061506961.1 E3 ubiquitin-protein ligase AMFR isoform X2 [Anopheles gambiae]